MQTASISTGTLLSITVKLYIPVTQSIVYSTHLSESLLLRALADKNCFSDKVQPYYDSRLSSVQPF